MNIFFKIVYQEMDRRFLLMRICNKHGATGENKKNVEK